MTWKAGYRHPGNGRNSGWCRWRRHGESDVRVNFGGVTFFSGDHLTPTIPGLFFQKIRWILNDKKAPQGAFFLRYLLAYTVKKFAKDEA